MKVVAVHPWKQSMQIRETYNTFFIMNNVSFSHLKRTLRNRKIADIVEDDCKFWPDVKAFLVSILEVPKDAQETTST